MAFMLSLFGWRLQIEKNTELDDDEEIFIEKFGKAPLIPIKLVFRKRS